MSAVRNGDVGARDRLSQKSACHIDTVGSVASMFITEAWRPALVNPSSEEAETRSPLALCSQCSLIDESQVPVRDGFKRRVAGSSNLCRHVHQWVRYGVR